MLWAWAAEKALGSSEYALRAANLPWAILTLAAFWIVAIRYRAPWLVVFVAIQPFFWQYVNEARPYAAQIAGSALMFAAICRQMECATLRTVWVGLFVLGAWIVSAASMLGVPFAIGAGSAFAVWLWINRVRLADRRPLLVLAFGTAIGVLLMVYFLWTLQRGGGGARLWQADWRSLAFVVYELLGFSGLGPPRLVLRELVEGRAAVSAPLLATWLALCGTLAILYAAAFFCWISNRQRPSIARPLLLFTGSGFLATFGAAVIMHFALLGRHLAAASPFLSGSLALGLLPLNRLRTSILILLAVALSASSLRLRFDPAYRRDDYRSAAAIAKATLAEGGIVWWAADWAAAEYYGLEMSRSPNDPSRAYHAANLTATSQRLPDLIVINRPNNFDQYGLLGALPGYRDLPHPPQGFRITRPATGL